MAFVAAMNSPALTKEGVKGSDVYTEAGVGDLRVTFFTQLVRGLSQKEITKNVTSILATSSFVQIQDLVVMAFQTRDVRGGKGERMLFYHMLSEILNQCPGWAYDLLKLVPEYGCWKDMWVMYSMCPGVQKSIDTVVLEQFLLDQESEKPSLLIKWLPREGTKDDLLARHFADIFFPETPSKMGYRMRRYRKCLSFLNKKLNTTEINMCGKTWAEIHPEHVPGRLMKRNKLAFFNQKKSHGEIKIRYPGNFDREECAEHFQKLLKDVKEGKVVMKGGHTTMPHEHIHEILYNRRLSEEEEAVIQGQWEAIRAETLKAGGLGKVVPMCDFSGSMDGVPKEVSLALGILISEVATPAFKDHILTFDSTPTWHSFVGKKDIVEKVRSTGHIGQGLSTNFQLAADLILKKLVEHKVAPEDAPTDLLVLTDMGFDQASLSTRSYHNVPDQTQKWQTHFQMIRENFERLGYTPPRIVCWNLRAEYNDYHAKAHEVGVVQLSGWSPSALKAIQGEGIVVETPYQGMRKILDDERYNRVREIVRKFFQVNATDVLRSA